MCIKITDVGCFPFWLISPVDVSYTEYLKDLKRKWLFKQDMEPVLLRRELAVLLSIKQEKGTEREKRNY